MYQPLGFWGELATFAVTVGKDLFSGGGGLSIEEYYPAVEAGQLLCPGPYTIGQAESALATMPGFRAEVDAILATDPYWQQRPPSSDRVRASAIVNWVHGGRDCTLTSGESALRQRVAQWLGSAEDPGVIAGGGWWDTAGDYVDDIFAPGTPQTTTAPTSAGILGGGPWPIIAGAALLGLVLARRR